MTKEFAAAIGLSIGLFALVSALPADALAQAGSGGARPPATDAIAGKTSRAGASNADMRLWSFGEGDKNFPDIDTAAHRECVRVVGSDEARDARAVHFCDLSHAKDPTEGVRCGQTYFANKAEAERAGFRVKPSNPLPAIVPVALAQRPDKAAEIAALTRALTAPDPEEPALAATMRAAAGLVADRLEWPTIFSVPSMDPDLLPCIELDTGAHPDAAVIWLHGLGADGNDFVPIVEEMRLPPSLSIRFVFPHAPVRKVTINAGMPMRAWYDIYAANLAERADMAGVKESQAQLEALIARERARGIAARRIVLAGFSQGGAIALYTGLRHPARLAAIVALSTYLVRPADLAAEASAADRDVPIFMAHGTVDPVVRLEWGDASRRALVAAGYYVEWHTYGMPHSVVWEEIEAVSKFLARTLASA